jgi:type II secretory pathway component GspD/PulD (secretin)
MIISVTNRRWSRRLPGAMLLLVIFAFSGASQLLAAAPPQVADKLREAAGIEVSIETRFVSMKPALLREQKVKLEPLFTVKKTDEKISGQFLDSDDVNAIIRAAQADVDATVMTAPRITLLNGQQGSVVVAQQQAYVSGWTEAVAGQKRKEQISTAQTGVTLDITPSVSANRKYITLAINPRVSQLMELKNVIWNKAPQENLKVQQPVMQVAEVDTVISIPDEGTFAVVVDRKDNLKENRDRILLLLIRPAIIAPRP